MATSSLTSVPGGWGGICRLGGPGGVKKSDFGSVSSDFGMPVRHLREDVSAAAWLFIFLSSACKIREQQGCCFPFAPRLGSLQPLALRRERSQQHRLLGAAGPALNAAGPFTCSATDNPRSTACRHLFSETQHHRLFRLEGTLEVSIPASGWHFQSVLIIREFLRLVARRPFLLTPLNMLLEAGSP